MKINNFLVKISNKINIFFKKHFGRTSGFALIMVAIISLFSATFFYYYLADFALPKPLAFLLIALLFYALYFILWQLLKIGFLLLKRVRARNLAIYAILIWGLKYFYDECLYYVNIDYFEIIFIALAFLVLVTFSKSLVSFVKNKKKLALLFLIPTTAILAGSVYFMVFPGFQSKEIYEMNLEKDKVAGKTEKYKVEVIDYQANPVDLTDFVNYSGNTKKIRDKFFGKGLNKTDVRGRIYAPKGLEKAPVLFVVHGNHRFTTKNYLGYDYLGHYLAKRGIAMVSVDMNMLNGFMKFGVGNENDARAILLLENMENIFKRNKIENSPLYNRFDRNNIAIMGHSRGGEAATIAYNFNELKFHPDNGKISHRYDFNIKGIITVAPTYNQYKPSDKNIILRDVNYFTIAGTNDADVDGFEGMLMYDNVIFSGVKDNFKTALYLGYANHGNFNKLWGDFDCDPGEGLFLNRKELLDADKQREILSAYTLNFLENSFGKTYNREIFKEGPYKYSDLPETNYYTRYMDSDFVKLADFEEDYDITTTSFPSGIINFSNLSKIYENSHEYGEKSSKTSGVFIESNKNSNYSLRFTEKIPSGRFLQFDIENLRFEDIADNIDLEMQDTWGNVARINLSDYKKIIPVTKTYLYKIDYLNDDYYERFVPQTLIIPIEDFKKSNSNLNLEEINKLEFKFKNNIKISIDNIGIVK
ncbi:alpha/beta hydrolase family protein [Peptoniphilus phoceensis]|uniref:alpha/beta hydrolase family protein n=1 Tax=Peptoniphilus phoceensis TaxID=1720298 RepID=UPI0007833EAF|nr:alpha/beta hydrolase [Peptoniphilus phoceensis]